MSQRFALALTLVNLLLFTFLLSEVRAREAAPVLRGRALEIVDSEGRVRASIVVHPAGTAADGKAFSDTAILRLIDTRGRPAVKLATTEEGDGCVVCVELEALIQTRRSLGAAAAPIGTALEYIGQGLAVVPIPHRWLAALPPGRNLPQVPDIVLNRRSQKIATVDPGADQDPLFDTPISGLGGMGPPPGQVFAVEQRDEVRLRVLSYALDRPHLLWSLSWLPLDHTGAGMAIPLGHAIGERPLLMLGVLLVVIGMQFFSLGLISEMITSHHEERAQERERAELLVDEILS